MLKIFISIIFCGLSLAYAQTAEKSPVLYGIIPSSALSDSPYDSWFTPGYSKYDPDPLTVAKLKKENWDKITVDVFFGSWCGDSKREVPNFLKLMNAVSFPGEKIRLIGVGSSDSLYKRSPGNEEKSLGIYRVPTFIFYKNGKEMNRITEYPVFSLERDLLTILRNEGYQSNFRAYKVINTWLADGILADSNINTSGLANQLRGIVNNESELNSLGYILIDQARFNEAVSVFRINYSLYPQSSNVISSLGEGYLKAGKMKNAVSLLERALFINKDPQAIKGILEILYKAKAEDR